MTHRDLRIAFMGTPDFTVPALEALIDHGHKPVCVYTQPPRPKGRGQKMQPSAVHEVAQAHGIPVFTPVSLKKDEAARLQFSAHDLDIAVVAGYGMMLPKDVLDAPRYGCLNIHPSLLPRWRGTSPVQKAIWEGDKETGVTIIRLVEQMDAGPMLARKTVAIRPQSTAQSLNDELWGLGAAMTVEIIGRIAAGEAVDGEAQDDGLATYAPLLKKEDGRVDWTQDAAAIGRQIRALNPWPGVWSVNGEGRRLKILEAEPVSESFTEPPGTIIDPLGHVVCGGDTGLRLLKIQPESGKAMDAVAAVNGGYLKVGEVLG